jgi:hypothetical protein
VSNIAAITSRSGRFPLECAMLIASSMAAATSLGSLGAIVTCPRSDVCRMYEAEDV